MTSITEVNYAPLSADATSGGVPAITTLKAERPEGRRPNERVFAQIALARYRMGAREQYIEFTKGKPPVLGIYTEAQASIREYCFYNARSNTLECVALPHGRLNYSCLEIWGFVSVTFELRVQRGWAWANAVIMSFN
jgi:hypothetical protein